MVPSDLRYTKDHEWVRVEGETATIGVTDFAAGQPGALLYVADSGPGVPPDDREKIFEPFYTTKEPGRGTGLGLAIVARAVHDMGGVVWVDTAREGGAAFKMFFPEASQ